MSDIHEGSGFVSQAGFVHLMRVRTSINGHMLKLDFARMQSAPSTARLHLVGTREGAPECC